MVGLCIVMVVSGSSARRMHPHSHFGLGRLSLGILLIAFPFAYAAVLFVQALGAIATP